MTSEHFCKYCHSNQAAHQEVHDESCVYICERCGNVIDESQSIFPLRRVIACARRAMIGYGWTRRRAIKFALGHLKAGTLSYSLETTPKYKPRQPMPGETQNMLTHRRRSMTSW